MFYEEEEEEIDRIRQRLVMRTIYETYIMKYKHFFQYNNSHTTLQKYIMVGHLSVISRYKTIKDIMRFRLQSPNVDQTTEGPTKN